jgi:hypothetical protein
LSETSGAGNVALAFSRTFFLKKNVNGTQACAGIPHL